jgi:hypothetical protein
VISKRLASFRYTVHKDPSFRAGIAIGIVGIFFSLLVRSILPGRLLGDPLPILLTASQLLRGVTQGLQYIQLQSLLFHVLYLALLGLVAIIGNRVIKGGIEGGYDPIHGTRIAVVLNVALIVLAETDSVMVGLWYLAAGYLSFSIAGLIARALSRILD